MSIGEIWEHNKLHRLYMEASSSLSGSSKRAKGRYGNNISDDQVINCSVDGCNADLRGCKEYHRRHKVCEIHSKTAKVTISGREQRFCQQCSRFHSLVEFDEGKRSCRKRLDGHNRRRRKPQHQHQTTPFLSQSSQAIGGETLVSFSTSSNRSQIQQQVSHSSSSCNWAFKSSTEINHELLLYNYNNNNKCNTSSSAAHNSSSSYNQQYDDQSFTIHHHNNNINPHNNTNNNTTSTSALSLLSPPPPPPPTTAAATLDFGLNYHHHHFLNISDPHHQHHQHHHHHQQQQQQASLLVNYDDDDDHYHQQTINNPPIVYSNHHHRPAAHHGSSASSSSSTNHNAASHQTFKFMWE